MKIKRQKKIIELISKFDIKTQDELIDKLHDEGFEVTQATISRDIRDLKLMKVAIGEGEYKYVLHVPGEGIDMTKLNVPILTSVKSVEFARNIIVIKTIPSMASAIAAWIDGMKLEEVLGCVAGDDCVIAVTRTEDEAAAICAHVLEIMTAG